jgi:hypothetical protein
MSLNGLPPVENLLTYHPDTRLERVMRAYRCTTDVAQRYLDLRDEGYSQYQALLMAGLADPFEDHNE